MSARTVLAAALAAALPTYSVRGYPHTPDLVTRPTVLVWQTRIAPLPEAPAGTRYRIDLEVWVVVSVDQPAAADDALDDALADVLDVLDARDDIAWDEAERAVLASTWPAYKITATAVGEKE